MNEGTFIENIPFEELKVGDSATYSRTLTEQDLILFAAATGDLNPLHLDEEYAKTTIFRKRIAHGMWAAGLISATLANVLPGPGSIYIGQTLNFKLPVYLGDTLTVRLQLIAKNPSNRIILDCVVTNQNGKTVVTGQAEGRAPSEKIGVPLPQLPKITIDQ